MRPPGPDPKRHQTAAARHLAARELVLRVALEPGIEHPLDARMLLQERRHLSAAAAWARTRSSRVSRPLSITQALNGLSDGPVFLR